MKHPYLNPIEQLCGRSYRPPAILIPFGEGRFPLSGENAKGVGDTAKPWRIGLVGRAGLGPAPTANPETVRFYRRGRTPAGPQIHAARPGGRALQPSTSRRLLGRPKCRCGTAPAAVFTDSGSQRPGGRGSGRLIAAPTADNGPFLENGGRGHTPGWLLSAFGRFTFSPSPTGFKKIFRDWVGEALGPPAVNRPSTVGSTNPGAVVKSQPLQFSTRPGPSGPKEIAECHSNFARRKYCKT